MRFLSAEREIRQLLLASFNAGVAAVQAKNCLPPHLPADQPAGRTAIFALGKAAGYMAQVALEHIDVHQALVVTRHGHMPPDWTVPPFAQVIEAGHPIPDNASLIAGEAAMSMARSLGKGDRLIALISGGGSALMAAPSDGISFAAKQAINRALLASGAPIADMNRVRAALSKVKGGGLASLAYPAEIFTYVISDVPGDNPAFVASGPTCPLPDGEDALSILTRWSVVVQPKVAQLLARATSSGQATHQTTVCARAFDALQAMAHLAEAAGYDPIILGDDIEGVAEDIACQHAKLAIDCRMKGRRVALISGGETSVTLSPGKGLGGRNLTYALALARELNGTTGISALAADSDGIDGTSDIAGAIVLPDTLVRANQIGLSATQMLSEQNSALFFDRLGDSIRTGPTGTNVNDLRIVLVDRNSFVTPT